MTQLPRSFPSIGAGHSCASSAAFEMASTRPISSASAAAQWSFWAMLENESLCSTFWGTVFSWRNTYVILLMSNEIRCCFKKPLAALDSALSERDYLAGENFTVADLYLASILEWGKMSELDFSTHLNVERWLEECLARPAHNRLRRLRMEAARASQA
jgi:glutathione S-transferase